eukprot:10057990-Ditylum_brightwellii.AAC.1
MALWAKEYDLKVPLKEWYFPASRLLRHWPMTHFYNTIEIKRKEYFTLNKTLNRCQQIQQSPCKLLHLMVQKRGQAITVMGCKDPSLTP